MAIKVPNNNNNNNNVYLTSVCTTTTNYILNDGEGRSRPYR